MQEDAWEKGLCALGAIHRQKPSLQLIKFVAGSGVL